MENRVLLLLPQHGELDAQVRHRPRTKSLLGPVGRGDGTRCREPGRLDQAVHGEWIACSIVTYVLSTSVCVVDRVANASMFVQGISSKNLFAWMGSTAMFVITLLSFFGYACWYYAVNAKSDRFQARILALVSVAGFSVALCVGFGVWISAFVVAPRAVIVGLLISDFAHLVFPVLRRKENVCAQSGEAVDEKA
jgi:hypothetical protein